MTKEYTMYTSKAFEGGTNARKVLEYSLSDKAAADRESVVNLMAAGMSLDEAVAQFNTDDNFSQWLTQFQNDLEQSIQ